MHIERLITMANDIGNFFSSEPDRREAVTGIANHIRRYWDPRMRRQIVDYVQAGNQQGLTELVHEAIRQLNNQSS